jgi:hypothetical protein
LEYLGVQQERQLRTAPSFNVALPGKIYQVTDMVNFVPCKERAEDLLILSRHQLTTVVAFLTGHAPMKKHLSIMGLFDGDPECRFCKMETETVHHIICCCEALARHRYNFFGKFFV